jgi:transposase
MVIKTSSNRTAPIVASKISPIILIMTPLPRTEPILYRYRRVFKCKACDRQFSANLYYRWSKDFLEAGEKRLAGDTARAATSDEVKDLRREASALKEVVAELTLENCLLKKSMIADGEDEA